MASNHQQNWSRAADSRELALTPQAPTVRAAADVYSDPRYVNGTQKVQ